MALGWLVTNVEGHTSHKWPDYEQVSFLFFILKAHYITNTKS